MLVADFVDVIVGITVDVSSAVDIEAVLIVVVEVHNEPSPLQTSHRS